MFGSEYMDRLVANILGMSDEYVSGLHGQSGLGSYAPTPTAGTKKLFLQRGCKRRMGTNPMPANRV